jgi:DNA-binding IscR family transcriptional regulator
MSTNSQFATMVHVLTLLACTKNPTSSTWIAGSVNTNPVVIRKIVGRLREAGLVKTLSGSAGGAFLDREPADITLAEVYNLVKAETFFGLRPSEPNPHCPVGRNIQEILIGICTEMDELIAAALTQITVADVMEQVSQRESPA